MTACVFMWWWWFDLLNRKTESGLTLFSGIFKQIMKFLFMCAKCYRNPAVKKNLGTVFLCVRALPFAGVWTDVLVLPRAPHSLLLVNRADYQRSSPPSALLLFQNTLLLQQHPHHASRSSSGRGALQTTPLVEQNQHRETKSAWMRRASSKSAWIDMAEGGKKSHWNGALVFLWLLGICPPDPNIL